MFLLVLSMTHIFLIVFPTAKVRIFYDMAKYYFAMSREMRIFAVLLFDL